MDAMEKYVEEKIERKNPPYIIDDSCVEIRFVYSEKLLKEFEQLKKDSK